MIRKLYYKLSDFQRFLLAIVLILILYLGFSFIIDNLVNYLEVNSYIATVSDKREMEFPSSRLFRSNEYYLEVIYGDGCSGLMKVSRYLYTKYEVGDIIHIRVYDKYRRSSNKFVGNIILLDDV